MVCPHCGYRAADGAEVCPRCEKPFSAPPRGQTRITRTATDSIAGVVWLVVGAALMVLSAILLVQSFGPAWEAIQNIPKIGGAWQALAVAEARFYTLPVILAALAHLMRVLSGLFLLLAGLAALLRGKGMGQARAALVLLLFGLFFDICGSLILYTGVFEATGIRQSLGAILADNAVIYLVQLLVLVVVVILLLFKNRSQKKQKRRKTAQQIQAARTARATVPGAAPASAPPTAEAPAAPSEIPPGNG